MRTRLILLAVLAATGGHAAPAPDRPPAKPACEPFTDPRELRNRLPAATVIGHVAPGTAQEPDTEQPDFGQELVIGTADLISDSDGKIVRISYAYWNTHDGCGGWEPRRGGRFTFDLADDKAADGALRVMRYSIPVGAR